MSIKHKEQKDLEALQQTLRKCPALQEVHFTKTGDHYFEAHEHEGKKYGHLNLEPRTFSQPDGAKYQKLVHTSAVDAEIVETLSRDEVLEYGNKPKEPKQPKEPKEQKPEPEK